MATDTPPPPLQFDTVPFRPDGAAPLDGLLLTALFSCGAALVIGAVVSFLHQWFYLVLFFPLGMGLGVGAAGAAGVRVGKVRSPLAAGALGVTAGVLVMLVSHLGDYLLWLRQLEQVAGPRAAELRLTFLEFMNLRAEQGVTLSKVGQGDKGMNLGYIGSYIYWLVEVAFAAGFAAAVMAATTLTPFCPACRSWKQKRVLGSVAAARQTVKEIVGRGELTKLLEPNLPAGHPVVFTAHVCPRCAEQGAVEINLQEVASNATGERRATDLGTWSFGGESWPLWHRLFAAPAPQPPAPSPETHIKESGGGQTP
jgi:hypothetical protein